MTLEESYPLPDAAELEIENAALRQLNLQLNEENWWLMMRIKKLEKQIESWKQISSSQAETISEGAG